MCYNEITLVLMRSLCDLMLLYTYTSIALDTTLLAQAYKPSQIELSSPGIQKYVEG